MTEESHRWPRRVVKRDYPNVEIYYEDARTGLAHKLVVIERLDAGGYGWVVDHGNGPLYRSCKSYASWFAARTAYERLFGRLH